MYNIILLIIALFLLIIFFYSFLKNYKKKEGFQIGDNNNLTTSAITDTDAYNENLDAIISQIKLELKFDSNKDKYIEILKKQSTIIKFCLLKKFLNCNLNFSEDYLLMLNQQTILSLNNQHYTGPEIVLHEVVDSNGSSNTSNPSGGGIITDLFGLS
jgi:hypothetical protein